jgi:hypothetical protein
MAVFIELTTDAFEEVLAKQKRSKQKGGRASGAGRRIARRPTRGLEIKDDTYAMFKLVSVTGRDIPLVDSSAPDGFSGSSGYANFMLQSVQEARMEKHQIVETFGDPYIFFFGESPRFIDVQVVLINSLDFNWEAEWWENYNKYLRGTKSVEQGARVYLFYDDNIVEGYIISSQAVKTSDQPLMLQMNFRMFITNHQNLSFIGDPHYPVRSSAQLPPNISLTSGNAGKQLIEKFRGDARNTILTGSGSDPTAETIARLNARGVPAGKKISELIRLASPSIGVSPDVWSEIADLRDTGGLGGATIAFTMKDMAERKGRPIRGLIAENNDEFVGAPPESSMRAAGKYLPAPGDSLSMLAPLVRKQWESEELFRDSITYLGCFAADINNHRSMAGLGLTVNFGATASAGASFTATAKASFGFGVTEQVGLSSRAEFKAFARDSLGAVYGSSSSSSSRSSSSSSGFSSFSSSSSSSSSGIFGANASAGVSASAGASASGGFSAHASASAGGGYGYHSDFSTGPGYGEAGFGDMGGAGFGSSTGATGDPGYLPPDKFTFAGVSDERSAFERFVRPKKDPTALGAGFGISARASVSAKIGLSAGVSFGIAGKLSAFGMIAISGTLDATGRARITPGFASAGRSAGSLGFTNPNPFGVNCPTPGPPKPGFSGFTEINGKRTEFP